MQKVVGSNPISRFTVQSQIRPRPALGRGPIVAQTPSAVLGVRLVVALRLSVKRIESAGNLGTGAVE